MSDPIAPTGAAVSNRFDLVEFADIQGRLRPFDPGASPARLPIQDFGDKLASELKATSDAYRRALARAVDPLAPGLGPEGLRSRTDGDGGFGVARAGGAAEARVVEATPLGVEAKGAVEEIGPSRSDAATPRLSATDAALEESVRLMMTAHSEIMKRQVGVMSATASLEAATSGARTTGQNVDTLLKGA